MATKGLQLSSMLYEERANEICKYIWGLNFKKDVMVDIFVDERATDIQAKVTRTRYFIYVNPNVSLDKIKQFLLGKGYITED